MTTPDVGVVDNIPEWQRRAVIAAAKQQDEYRRAAAERDAQHNKMIRDAHFKHLAHIVGEADARRAEISDDGQNSTLDGHQFYLNRDYELLARATCPECGAFRYSYALTDIESLGNWLTDYQGQYHECHPKADLVKTKKRKHVPTDAERALALVRELLALASVNQEE